MSHNRFLSEIFENLDVDYQMLISMGKNEPFYRPRNLVFSHVIGVYFIAFFIEHPVIQWLSQLHFLLHIYSVFKKEGVKVKGHKNGTFDYLNLVQWFSVPRSFDRGT